MSPVRRIRIHYASKTGRLRVVTDKDEIVTRYSRRIWFLSGLAAGIMITVIGYCVINLIFLKKLF